MLTNRCICMRHIKFLLLAILLAMPMALAVTYYPSEDAQYIIRIENSFGTPVNSSCVASILYPDKSVFMSNQSMTASPFGNYYVNFTAPSTLGIYETLAKCDAQVTFYSFRTLYQSGSFKVEQSPVVEVNLTNITQQLTEINNTLTSLNGGIYYMNETINNINLTTLQTNTTVNAMNYTINNFNTTIVGNITANITGDITTAVNNANDSLWIRIRNLMFSLWSTQPSWV